MRTYLACLLALVLPAGCLTRPPPWVPSGDWVEVDDADWSVDVSTETDAQADVVAGESNDSVEASGDQGADDSDIAADSELAPDGVDQHADNHTDEGTDKSDASDVPDIDSVDQAETPDVPCPPGYAWDAEKGECVSFCPADQYFEVNLMKCVYYPCCDIAGAWKASLLDTDTMGFTIYELQLDQAVSYLQAVLTLDSPPEVAECSGSLEKKELVLYCISETYSLQLSSTTVYGTGKFSGFYSYSYKKGGVKAGPVNFEKK